MKILPSWKEKRRYLLIKINNNRVRKEEVKKEIEKQLLYLIGIINYSKARPFFIDIENITIKNKEYIIMSINRKYMSYARACLLLCKYRLECLFVSGTLRKLKRKIKELNK